MITSYEGYDWQQAVSIGFYFDFDKKVLTSSWKKD